MNTYLTTALFTVAGMILMLIPVIYYYLRYSKEKMNSKNSAGLAAQKTSELGLLQFLTSGDAMRYDSIMSFAQNIRINNLKGFYADRLQNFFQQELSSRLHSISILGDFLYDYDQGDRRYIDVRTTLLEFLNAAIKSLTPVTWARMLFEQLQKESTHQGLHGEKANKAKRFMLNVIKTCPQENMATFKNELEQMIAGMTEADLTNRKIIEAGAEIIFREIAQSNKISI